VCVCVVQFIWLGKLPETLGERPLASLSLGFFFSLQDVSGRVCPMFIELPPLCIHKSFGLAYVYKGLSFFKFHVQTIM